MSSTEAIQPDPLLDNWKMKLFKLLDEHMKTITQMRQDCANDLAAVEDKLIQDFADKLNVESQSFEKELSMIKFT